MFNHYTRYARIGNGHHGEVFLCFRIDSRFAGNDVRQWFPVAMKSVRRDTIIDKYSRLKANRIALTTHGPSEPAVVDKLNTTEFKIKKEIAIMKKLSHPNVVRLFEVIDDRMKEKVYMVMEYLGGGEIKWRTDNEEPTLTLSQTRRVMRDAVLGLEYLHYQGIIHRDIKPANLLWTEDRHHVKIADFGVSHFSYAQRLAEAGEEGINTAGLEEIIVDESDLTRRAGTPAFLAPELIFEHFEEKNKHFVVSSLVPRFSSKQPAKPQITKSIDVWALGVTLYCLLFGKTPFMKVTEGGTTEFALYRAICNKDWEVTEYMCRDRVPTGGRHPKKSSRNKQPEGAKVISLLERFLQKDQTKRITLDEVKRHQWITEDLLNPAEWYALTSPGRKAKLEVTKADTFMAVSSVPFRWGLSGFGRGMSALFKPLKARSRATPAGVHYSPRSVAFKNDSRAGGLFPCDGNRKSVAIAGVQDVHVYGRSDCDGSVDKGKGKVVDREASQPSSPGGLTTTSSSPALEAIRRQRSQMGILGHEQRELDRYGDSTLVEAYPSGTPIDPAPRLEDIMSIVTWRPTKYPTPTTSLRPLLANIHADGTSTFHSPPRSKKPHANVSVITPMIDAPARTVSTLESELRPGEDLLGLYGSDGELGPNTTAAVLNKFKRASSWGEGDEVVMGRISMGAGMDMVSVTSIGGELDDTVKLMGAGGVESLGSPVSPVSPNSPVGSAGGGQMSASGSGSAGEGIFGSVGVGENGGWQFCGSGGASGSGSCGDGSGMPGWDQFGEGIRKWRSYRKKHHHRNASSSTLPWVDSLDDLTFGVNDGLNINDKPNGEGSLERSARQAESRGELTIEWMDDNYSTPGGYYGSSMGPATQFWRHGRGAWCGRSVSSSGDEEDSPTAGPSKNGQKEREVVRRRGGPLDKFLNGEDSDLEDDGEGSEYGISGVRIRFNDEGEGPPEEGGREEDEDESESESESEDEDDRAQQITIKSKGSIRH